MAKKTKISESRFDELLDIVVPNFNPFTYCVEDFCGYYKEKGLVCPFLEADQREDRQFKHINNWDIQNCLWACKWFIKVDFPEDARWRANIEKGKIKEKKKKPT